MELKKQTVTTVICDFDNTLFNWFDQWFNSFSKLVDKLEQLGLNKEQLLVNIRTVNKVHGTSEYHNLLHELDLDKELGNQKEDIIKELNLFYLQQKQINLKLYPDVLDTLRILKEIGCKIIIYTESRPLYSNKRIIQLRLDGIVDVIFSPEHHVDVEPSVLENNCKLKSTEHFSLPKQDFKPNPKTLTDIINYFGSSKDEVIYIGDSKMKDIQMANQAGVTSVWAKYGCDISYEEYSLLKQVSHWTDEDIAKEEEIKRNSIGEHLIPKYTLNDSFQEVLNFFEFKKF
jgi:FMN phosphatase YigB (HAD superfamily)